MSIEEAAKKYSDNWGEQSAFETGGYSDAAKQYWFEIFKKQYKIVEDEPNRENN